MTEQNQTIEQTTETVETKENKIKKNAKSIGRVLRWPLLGAGWVIAALVAMEFYNYMNAPVTDKIMRVFGF